MNHIICAEHLTKDYGNGRGVFDIGFSVEQGEAFGFLGPNGAGKTTTIRQLMGFIRPTSGSAQILGLDCFANAAQIQAQVGYLPGELAFPNDMTGNAFIAYIAKLKGISNLSYANALSKRFELDGKQKLRKMSKGTKQKVGIVCAFMSRPRLLILDEPTSGLDPLMQNEFIRLVLEEKANGATIFLSSHIFEEVERICNRIAILKAGKLVSVQPIEALKSSQVKQISFLFANQKTADCFSSAVGGTVLENTVFVEVKKENLAFVLQTAAQNNVCDINMQTQSLEDMFLGFYGKENQK